MIIAEYIELPDEAEFYETDYLLNLLDAAAIDEEEKVFLRAEINNGLQRERIDELKELLYRSMPNRVTHGSNASLTEINKHIKNICGL